MLRTAAITALVLAALTAPAHGAQLFPSEAPGSHVRWERKPSEAEVGRLFPGAAFARKSGGYTAVRCGVELDGQLHNCAIVPGTEAPEGLGFGRAALDLASDMRIKTDHPEAGDSVVIPMTWITGGMTMPQRPKAFTDCVLDEARYFLASDRDPPLAPPLFGATDPRFASLAPIGAWFPELAQRSGAGGLAAVQCEVGEQGRLATCGKLIAVPERFGFGEAALAMAKNRYLKVSPDHPAGSLVRVVVRFPTPPHTGS